MLIEVFKTGTHIDAKGNSKTYTAEMLDRLAYNYAAQVEDNPNNLAPLVKGHPDANEPALGWVKKLYRRGRKLIAQVDNVSKELIDEIKNEKFKYFSISLYPDMQLRHIGILGAVPPAVKDLNPNGVMYFHSCDSHCTAIAPPKDGEPAEAAALKADTEPVEPASIPPKRARAKSRPLAATCAEEDMAELKNYSRGLPDARALCAPALKDNCADAEIKDYWNKQAEAEQATEVIGKLQEANNELLKQIHDLQRRNRSYEFNAYVNSVAQNSQITWTPAQKTAFVEILEAAAGCTYASAPFAQTLDEQFASKGDTESSRSATAGVELTAKIKSFVESMEFAAQPGNEILTELNLSDSILPAEAATHGSAPVDPARQRIHLAALSYCQKHPDVTYNEAVAATLMNRE